MPCSLLTGEEAVMFAPILAAAVEAGTMPPWPPSAACNSYEHDRSLPAGDREVLLAWVEEGAALGDPSEAPPSVPPPEPIAWDLELAMPEAYAPTQSPDDYRCFVIDWPEDQVKYVTGMDVIPEQRAIAHHGIARLMVVSTPPMFTAVPVACGATCR